MRERLYEILTPEQVETRISADQVRPNEVSMNCALYTVHRGQRRSGFLRALRSSLLLACTKCEMIGGRLIPRSFSQTRRIFSAPGKRPPTQRQAGAPARPPRRPHCRPSRTETCALQAQLRESGVARQQQTRPNDDKGSAASGQSRVYQRE